MKEKRVIEIMKSLGFEVIDERESNDGGFYFESMESQISFFEARQILLKGMNQ